MRNEVTEVFEDMAVECSTAELAKYLNITQKQLRTLEQNGVLKRIAHNRWNPTQCAHLFIKHLQESRGKSNLEVYREQHMKAKAEMAEMSAALMAGELGYVEEIRQDYEDEVLQIRTTLLTNLPRVLSLLPQSKTTRARENEYRNAVRKELHAISRDRSKKQTRRSKITAEQDP